MEGNADQVFHTYPRNKCYLEDPNAKEFVEKYLSEAISFSSDAETLLFAAQSVESEGIFMELGVWKGRTINFIAALHPTKTIYGFDSFQGLPEDWERGDMVIPKHTFRIEDPNYEPLVLKNVEVIKGRFQETLSAFVAKLPKGEKIAFLHVDSDLYSSAATAFSCLEDRLLPGCIIIFDEFYNYPGAERHEQKALQEFLQRTSLQVKYLAYNHYHEQVVVKIIEKK